MPTPPLPPKKKAKRSVRFDVHPGDLVGGGNGECAWLGALQLADPRENLALGLDELLIADLAELQPHLRLEQLLAERGVVLCFRFSRGHHLLEHESDAADQQVVQDEH